MGRRNQVPCLWVTFSLMFTSAWELSAGLTPLQAQDTSTVRSQRSSQQQQDLERLLQDQSRTTTALEVKLDALDKNQDRLLALALALFGTLFAALVAFYVRERKETQHLQRLAELEKRDFAAQIAVVKTDATNALHSLKTELATAETRATTQVEQLRQVVLDGLRTQMDLLAKQWVEQSERQRRELLESVSDEIIQETTTRLPPLLDQYAATLARLGASETPLDHTLRSQFYLAQGDPASLAAAAEEAQRAIELDDKHPGGWIQLARARKRSGQLSGARDALTRAHELDPHNTATMAELAAVALQLYDNEVALKWLRRLQADPQFTNALWLNTNLAVALRRTDHPSDAIAALEDCLRINPRHSPARHQLVELLLDEELFDRALQVSTEGLDVNRLDVSLLVLRARALDAVGRTNEALEDLDAAQEQNASDVKIYLTRGRVLTRKGDYPGAINNLRRGLGLRGPPGLRALLHIALADALGSSGNLDLAVSEARDAVRLGPRYPLNHTVLIHWLLLANRPADGLSAALQALKDVPPTAFRANILLVGALCAAAVPIRPPDATDLVEQFLSLPAAQRHRIRWDLHALEAHVGGADYPERGRALALQVLAATRDC